jgi:hypothetical protein
VPSLLKRNPQLLKSLPSLRPDRTTIRHKRYRTLPVQQLRCCHPADAGANHDHLFMPKLEGFHQSQCIVSVVSVIEVSGSEG